MKPSRLSKPKVGDTVTLVLPHYGCGTKGASTLRPAKITKVGRKYAYAIPEDSTLRFEYRFDITLSMWPIINDGAFNPSGYVFSDVADYYAMRAASNAANALVNTLGEYAISVRRRDPTTVERDIAEKCAQLAEYLGISDRFKNHLDETFFDRMIAP